NGELGITFGRARDGLSFILESKKWKLDRGKSYPVRLTAGPRSGEAHAPRETKNGSSRLARNRLSSRIPSANNPQLRAEGATLRVPLDNSSVAFERLDECFTTREAPKINPLVKRNASARHLSLPR